jgi:hypothetical protein
LYEKGAFFRIAEQAEDEEATTKSLEDLREAISDYQVSDCLRFCGLILQ